MLNNYTIKRMIPRLIAAAILVNASYYLAVVAVDITNILGYNLYALFGSGALAPDTATAGSTVSDGWQTVVNAILIAGIGVALFFALTAGPAVLIVLALIVFILIARKALIVLLVIISPIAFVAWLLPNTEDIFKKWWKMFSTLLLVFPVIGLIFGASELASKILLSAAGAADQLNGEDEGAIMLYIVALSVAVVPLIAVPAVLKGALGAAGKIGAKLQGAADRSGARAARGASEKAKEKYKNSFAGQYGQYRSNEANKRRALMQAGVYKGKLGKANPRNWRSAASGALVANTGQFGSRIRAAGGDLDDKMWAENVGNQQKFMSMESWDDNKLLDTVANGKNAEEKAAAAGLIMKNGSMDSIHKLHDSVEAMGDDADASGIRKQMIHDMGRTPFGWGSGDIANMKRGKQTGKPTYGDTVFERLDKGKMSGSKWAGADPDDQRKITDMAVTPANRGGLSDSQFQNVLNAADESATNPNLSLSDEAKAHNKRIFREASRRGLAPQRASTPTPQPTAQPTSSGSGGGGNTGGGGSSGGGTGSNAGNQGSPAPQQPAPPQQPSTTQHQGKTYTQSGSGLYVPHND